MITRRPLKQVLVALLVVLLVPAIAHAETDTAGGAPDFDHIILEDGKVIVTEPADGQSPPTIKPPEFSSIRILRDGTVVTSSKTTATTQAGAVSAQRAPAVGPDRAASGRTSKSATASSPGTAAANRASAAAAPEASEAAAVVVASEQITNPAIANNTLPETGVDVRPYVAVALLLIVAGRMSYVRGARDTR